MGPNGAPDHERPSQALLLPRISSPTLTKSRTSKSRVFSKYPKLFLFLFVIGPLTTFLIYIKVITAVFSDTHPGIGAQLSSERHYTDFIYVNSEAEQLLPTPIQKEKIACHLPKLKPFDPSILPYYHPKKYANCSDPKHPLIFQADGNLIKTINSPSDFGYTNCSYCPVYYFQNTNKLLISKKSCVNIQGSTTKVAQNAEFVLINCDTKEGKSKTVKGFHFINPKPEIAKRLEAYHAQKEKRKTRAEKGESGEEVGPLNVVIIGIDAVSHMNFLRVMPKSSDYLTRNLSAYSMWGYTKVGENTFPNIVPVTTGFFDHELKAKCVKTLDQDYFDPCPFIWKRFASTGYTTAYGEDESQMAIFNYFKKGFRTPPADYFHSPLAHAYQKLGLNHRNRGNADMCYAEQTGFDFMMDFVKNMAIQMKGQHPYFQFIWTSSLTHDHLNDGSLGDQALLDTLQILHTDNHLNKTLLVVMSDHGIRWGDILSTLQGRLEERMPLLYFVFPEWFRDKYPSALTNMLSNRHKLTTPFDLHETLKDFLAIQSISNEQLKERESQLLKQTRKKSMPRGISLFLPIPSERLCEDARIPLHYCVCRDLTPINVENNTLVEQAARTAVHTINGLFINFPQCLPLTLSRVLNAQILKYDLEDASNQIGHSTQSPKKPEQLTLSLTFQVSPSQALFETTMRREVSGNWAPTESISRINLYGTQSRCVLDYNLKKYCYCA